MKKLFFLIFIFGGLFPPKIHAQEKSLEQLPAKERDSILMALAKEAILICGPDYYRDHELPEISMMTWAGPADNKKNDGRKLYELKYPQDSTKEELFTRFSATVWIWADTRKIIDICFGNGVFVHLDGIDYRHTKMKKNPYQQAKDMKPVIIYTRPPKNFNSPYHELNRDSLLVDFSRKLVKKNCPGYYKDHLVPKIETERFTGEGDYNGELYFRLVCPPDKKRETPDKEYSVIIEVWEEGSIRRFLFESGLEIKMGTYIDIWAINTKDYLGYSTGDFQVYPPEKVCKLDRNRKTVNLETLPKEHRDSVLVKQGKEILLAIGPEYRRERQHPLIDTLTRVDIGDGQSRPYYHHRLPPKVEEKTREPNETFPGRKYYEVYFYGGEQDRTLHMREMAHVRFWADTGDPFSITLGNAVIVNFDGLDYRKIKVNVPHEDMNTVEALKQKK